MQFNRNTFIVLQEHIRKIVVIGPESTGKSTLTRQLAATFGTSYADEYARAFLEGRSQPYSREDLLAIAQGQLQQEEKALAAASGGLTFLDTDLYVIKVWSESRFGTCAEWILQQIATRRYDLYILTDIDMPWEDDPLREHPQPEMRAHFFNIYQDIVLHAGVPFIHVRGDAEARLAAAAATVRQLLARAGFP